MAPSTGERPWQDLGVTTRFAKALQRRRAIQAKHILGRFPAARTGRVLDYGCGQGVFLASLRQAKVDAWGTDIDLLAPGNISPPERTIQLGAPWQLPPGTWNTVCLLDVIEHHDEPVAFLSRLQADNLLVKVPLADGPIAVGARVLARLRHPDVLEALFLVNDIAPHTVLLTKRGLCSLLERAGWRRVRGSNLADVGRELPDRIRIGPSNRSWIERAALSMIGIVLMALSPVWSDTYVSQFVRIRPHPATPPAHDLASGGDGGPHL